MKDSDRYILLLMDLGEYNEHRAAEIWRKELKGCRSIRERDQKCYLLLEERRAQIGLAPIYKEG